MNTATIVIDFDGTCVTHEYPNIGKDINAAPVLKRLIEAKHRIILFTMRSGKLLEEAVQWCKMNQIELYGINENPNQKNWTSSPKPYGNIYIDDRNLGCPLIYPSDNKAPYVDWLSVELWLIENRYLNE